MRNYIAVFAVLLVAASITAQSSDMAKFLQTNPTLQLQRQLNEMTKGYDGKVAFYSKNLATGDSVGIDADRPVQTASVIKLPLFLQAYEQVKAGKIKLDDPIELTKANQVAGSGVLPFLDPGLKLTLKDTLTLMIMLSDNTATNLTIDKVGLKPTNQMLADMGLKNTYFYKKVYVKAVEPQPADFKQFGLGKTTAREMAAVMEDIYTCKLGDRKLCDQMLFILRNQQYRAMIPRYIELPDTSEDLSAIGDKIGMLDDVRNDVAFVISPKGTFVISAFTYQNEDKSWTPENKAEILIGKMAKAVVDAWGGGKVSTGGEVAPKH
jgi:beta-lactamase class A